MTRKSARHVSHSPDATQPEEQPAPAPSKVQNICLSQLVLSPTNVRKTPATAAEEAQLEASIRARGILQNLIVHPTPIDCRGVYEVDAGGRRLKILQKLAAEGVIDADHPIPCLVREPAVSLETSLMENTIRAAMHPTDEFVAMAGLIDAGATIDDVAKRFGTSERHVKQRLRLGKLAPELLEAYRAGDISLDVVTAFTLGADHAAQLAVWNQLKDNSYIQPHTVKRLLTEAAVSLDSDVGMFVGAQAYEAAGGAITRDLFSEDDEGFMDDGALVHRLAIEKLEAKAEELRPQWAWTKAVLDPEYRMLAQYGRIEPRPAKVPAELAAEIERIEQRLAEFENIAGDEWTDELAAEMEQLEERRTEIDGIVDGLAVYTKKDRKRAGCIVTIGRDGSFELHQGLVERSAAAKGQANNIDGAEIDDDSDEPFVPVGDDDEIEPQSRSSADAEQALRKECGFSQLLVDDLKAHRHQITRAHLAGNFEVAFDLALYALCVDLFRGFRHHPQPLELRVTEANPRSSLNDLSGTPADRWIEAQGAALELDWLKLPPAQGFEALASLPLDEKRRLFAWCVASTLKPNTVQLSEYETIYCRSWPQTYAACYGSISYLNGIALKPQLAIETSANPVIEAAGLRLNVGFEDYWRPTAANYWGRAKKAHGLGIGQQILGDRWARDHAGDKKPVLAAALELAFDPQKNGACINLDQDARQLAATWLPPGMSYAGEDSPSPEDERRADSDGAEAGSGDETGLASADLPAFLTEDEAATFNA